MSSCSGKEKIFRIMRNRRTVSCEGFLLLALQWTILSLDMVVNVAYMLSNAAYQARSCVWEHRYNNTRSPRGCSCNDECGFDPDQFCEWCNRDGTRHGPPAIRS